MYRYFVLAITALACAHASAACWKVAELSGSSARAADGFAIGSDGFSGQTFEVTITSNSGAVKPSNLSCRPATKNSLVCIDSKEGRLTVETWSVDESQKKLVHTKAISGYGTYDGGNLFVGKIVGACSAG